MSVGVTQPRSAATPAATSTRLGPVASEERSLRAAATSAGVGILLLAVLATFGVLFAVDGLITPGDAARTARNITESETLFRLGIVSLLLTAAVDVLVAWGLYRVFRWTSSGLSMLAAWFRLAYATAFLVAVGHLVGALRLLHAPSGAFSAAQNQAAALSNVDAFHDAFRAGLVLFGVHLLLVGYLAYQSNFIPRLLGALVCLSGAGYAFDGLASVLSNGSAPATATVTFVGEFLLGVWLLARGGPGPTTSALEGVRPGGATRWAQSRRAIASLWRSRRGHQVAAGAALMTTQQLSAHGRSSAVSSLAPTPSR